MTARFLPSHFLRSSLRGALSLTGIGLLAACTPSVPDSGAGVGFQDYNSYIRGSTAAAGIPPAGVDFNAPAPAQGFDPAAAAAAIDRAEGIRPAAAPSGYPPAGSAATGSTLPPLNALPLDPSANGGWSSGEAPRPRGNAPAGIKVESGELVHSNPSISDENDFNAVAARETIASDADRIAKNRAEYVVVQPGALPVRPGETGPNIVAFALATTHAPGVQMYKRGRAGNGAACGNYASPDLAQQDFLARGGPDRDRKGLDPDGDGFACGWDPRPFRTALQ